MDKFRLTDSERLMEIERIVDLMQKSQRIASNACNSRDRAIARASYEAFLHLYQNLIDGGRDHEPEH